MKKFLMPIILLSAALLYCSCSPKINVTFDPDNGIDIPQTVTAVSGFVPPPSIPVKEGYFFGGWWTEKEGGQQWLFSERKIYDGLLLYARWLDTMLTVSFESNLPSSETLGTPEIKNQNLAHGSKVVKPDEPELAGDNYFFKGWSKSADIFTPWVFGTDTVFENTIIYAFWERFAVVSFDSGLSGGEEIVGGLSLLSDKKVRSGSKVVLPVNLKTNTQEHLFAGWYSDAAFSQRWYESSKVNENIILYAKWDESVKVNFDINAPQNADVNWDYPTEYILRKNTSLYGAVFENKSLEWFTSRCLIPYDRNYLYAVNTWYYLSSGGKEEIFTADKRLSEDCNVYAKWREANYYKFDGAYYELFHPVTQDEENEGVTFLNLGDLPYYQETGAGNGYFAGWFYKSDPSLQYFGEKVQPHTEFVSKTFSVTSGDYFDFAYEEEEYYAVLKNTFNSSVLVLPQFLNYSKSGGYWTVDKFRIDLTAFPDVETIVFSGYQLYNLKNLVRINYRQDNKKINFYGEFGYNYCVYDNFVYQYIKADIKEYQQMPYHNSETPGRNFYYSSFAVSFEIRSGYLMPAKMLPQGFQSNAVKFPVILAHRFLNYYRQGLKNMVLFCQNDDIEFVKSRIGEGVFYGSVVYDINYLENAEANYLIADNKLIYYMCGPSDSDTANGNRFIVDLTKEGFSSVTRINTNSIILNTAVEGTVSSVSADLYIPGAVKQIESRAVQCPMNLNIYLLGECPEIIYKAKSSLYYYAADGEAAAFDINDNTPHGSIGYYDINYFIDSQYWGSYSDWAAKIQASSAKVHIQENNYI